MDLRLGSAFTVAGLLFACGDSVPAAPGGNGGATSTSSGGYGGLGGEGGNWSPTQPFSSVGTGGFYEPSCFDESKAVGLGPLIVKTGQDLCTPELIAESFPACVDLRADEAICTAFVEANPACANCLGVDSGTGTIHPALFRAGIYWVVNNVACEAAVQDKVRCAQEAADLQMCVFRSCGECDPTTEMPECMAFSERGICGENYLVTDDCSSLFPAYNMDSPQCTGSDFVSLYNNVANYLCGPAIVPPPP